MTAGIFKLPNELHCNIANHLDKEDARSFRLTCKALQVAATQALFSFVRLYPCDESVARYNSILSSPDINKWVRHVELNTLEKDEEDEEQGESPDFSDEAIEAFASFPKFTNLTSVALRFAPNATSGSSWSNDGWEWSEWPQNYEFRQPLIQDFLTTLAEPSASRITRVCIDNIQNINDREGKFMQSDAVVSVLSRLRALQLFIITEDHAASPENNLTMEELHTFMKELPPLWLQPAANNLTTLVLYQTAYFGYSPKLDLRGVHFPNLRTLALGNYVFSHDWQLDWLSSHKTLENLYLDDCIALYFAYLINSPLDKDGYPLIKTVPHNVNGGEPPPTGTPPGGAGSREYHFIDMPWSKIFNHLASNLSSLLKFRVGSSPRWDRRHKLVFDRLDYEQTSICLNADRYQMFDGGIGPSQYTDEITRRPSKFHTALQNFDRRFDKSDFSGGEEVRRFLGKLQEQEEEDKEALLGLLRAIGYPVTENTVEGLKWKESWGWRDEVFPLSY